MAQVIKPKLQKCPNSLFLICCHINLATICPFALMQAHSMNALAFVWIILFCFLFA